MRTNLICWSNEAHLSQVYAGLTLLHRQGVISLEQQIVAARPPNLHPSCLPHLRRVENWHCRIETGGVSYYVDVHDDSYISQDALQGCDVYLKRGYVRTKNISHKVRPLGLNYHVCADGIDQFELARRFKLFGPQAAAKYVVKRPMSVSDLESTPAESEPGVLFLCRTWEPSPERSKDKNDDIVRINESRADCIVALRKEFGPLCVAGFSRTPYAVTHFPHAIVNDSRATDRKAYLRLVRDIPICVASIGLHQSNGWKLGEYVACSRAIVSEQLHHEVPDFQNGRNYLGFTQTAECVEAVGVLMESKSARAQMAEANHHHYLSRLRPDRMMSTALALVDMPAAGNTVRSPGLLSATKVGATRDLAERG